jgi:hypothetical protein
MTKTVKILVIKNPVEASLLDEILKEKDIPHIIKSYHDLAYDGLWQTPTAWGQIDAPDEFRDQILEIYQQITLPDENDLSEDDDDDDIDVE